MFFNLKMNSYINRDLADFVRDHETIEEREDTFMDPADLMRDVIDPSKDPDLALSSNGKKMVMAFSPSPANQPQQLLISKFRQAAIQNDQQLIEDEESEQSFRDKELSFYAVEAETLEDLVRRQKVKNLSEYTILRVMHCTGLSSMKGVTLFPQLRELNLSSNSIMSLNPLLEQGGMVQFKIESLNLSCNKLTQLMSIGSIAHCLRKLVLSHNRLVSLQPLSLNLPNSPALEFLDLNDNYIGELEMIKYLQPFTNLRELIFQGVQNGSNPMCDFENYNEAVKMYLPQLTKLDGRELIPGHVTQSGNVSKALPTMGQVQKLFRRPQQENQNPNRVKSPQNIKSQVSPIQKQNQQLEVDTLNKQIAEKDKLIDKLYYDVKDLHSKVDRVTQERNEAIEKFSESERYWRGKQAKQDKEYQTLFELNQSIKEDNSSILLQMDKFSKRIRQLENELLREQDLTKERDDRIATITRDAQSQARELERCQGDCARAQREQQVLKEEVGAEVGRHRETKELMKKCEEKCTQLYQELIATNKEGVERWSDIQKKYEDSQAALARQAQINEDLQNKLSEYKMLTTQAEYSWQQKYQQAQQEKEMIVETIKAGSEKALHVMKSENERRLTELQAQCKEDVLRIDGLRKEALSKCDQYKAKYQKSLSQLAELKDVLQLAADADSRKDAIIEEIKVSAAQACTKLDQERDQLLTEQKQLHEDKLTLDKERRDLRERDLECKHRLEESDYHIKELMHKIQHLTLNLEARTKECDTLQNELSAYKRQLREMSNELENARMDSENQENAWKKECEELRVNLDDMNSQLQYKITMLEDQNKAIQELKERNREMEESVRKAHQRVDSRKSRYEDRVQQAESEAQAERQRADECMQRIQELEQENESLQSQIDQLEKELESKDERLQLVDTVEAEINGIKDVIREKDDQIRDREHQLSDLTERFDYLNQQSQIKDQEIRVVIDKMEGYKKVKDAEVLKLRKKLASAEEDVKLLIVEQERQKRVAEEKMKQMLSEMFK
ncbi:hypothetical protein FGO68_gene14015 [Halteria grandinella]|uniref:Uncharacterized protein n=1 Tax=Halteria grandinella TaxID=5974 RepID=A0A8J8P5Q5_HALGN|nr:hypothetical protein FGO68_gene14015 [Halteria grandinella]